MRMIGGTTGQVVPHRAILASRQGSSCRRHVSSRTILQNTAQSEADECLLRVLGESYRIYGSECGNPAGAFGALSANKTGQAIPGALLADEETSGLLNRAIGDWLVRPGLFEMLEYRKPKNFTPDLLVAFSRVNAMREFLDRSVQQPDRAVT
ncbi:hypothetical protein [Streptomyces erythrochromogenes]|uniref:hypothetical protein n=1 Tax=Streptomyces erythrochromogenes TaxID=285574 RepID=UPI0038296E2C